MSASIALEATFPASSAGPPAEEAGKVASSAIDALKGTPAVLALVIFNLLFFGVVVYVQYTNGERWEKLFELMLKQCIEVSK